MDYFTKDKAEELINSFTEEQAKECLLMLLNSDKIDKFNKSEMNRIIRGELTFSQTVKVLKVHVKLKHLCDLVESPYADFIQDILEFVQANKFTRTRDIIAYIRQRHYRTFSSIPFKETKERNIIAAIMVIARYKKCTKKSDIGQRLSGWKYPEYVEYGIARQAILISEAIHKAYKKKPKQTESTKLPESFI